MGWGGSVFGEIGERWEEVWVLVARIVGDVAWEMRIFDWGLGRVFGVSGYVDVE